MIGFFRKIRQNLLSSSPEGKYLFYAIGEIFLVVIGILIALQINNWNESVKQDRRIRQYLQNLVENLKSDEARFRINEQGGIFRYYSLQYLLGLAGEPPYDPDSDGFEIDEWNGAKSHIWKAPIPENYNKEFIELAFQFSALIGAWGLTSSTIDELKNTGEFSNLKNQALKDSINYYYNDWSFRLGPSVLHSAHRSLDYWHNALNDEGLVDSESYLRGDPIEFLKNNRPLLGRLRAMVRSACWHAITFKRVYENAQRLQQTIENTIAY